MLPRKIFESSITAAEFGKDRETFLVDLGKKMSEGIKLATIGELEQLWFELQREINASGEVSKFTAEVIANDGTVDSREVVRVGNFNAVSDGQYLTYSPSRGMYTELPSQPAGRFTGTTSDIIFPRDLNKNYDTILQAHHAVPEPLLFYPNGKDK